MVNCQIRPNKVVDEAVVAALGDVARERFVDEALRGVAYVDADLPLGGGRFLIEPLVLARMLQAAEIRPADRVLDIGCATGYSSAVLARLAASVVALESDAALAAKAAANLRALALGSVTVVTGPLNRGCPERGPYDVILIGGAVAAIPDAIRRQLADGGRLCAVVAAERGAGRVRLELRSGRSVTGRDICDAAAPLLHEFIAEKGFVF